MTLELSMFLMGVSFSIAMPLTTYLIKKIVDVVRNIKMEAIDQRLAHVENIVDLKLSNMQSSVVDLKNDLIEIRRLLVELAREEHDRYEDMRDDR